MISSFTNGRIATLESRPTARGADGRLFRGEAFTRQIPPGPHGDRQVPHHGPGTKSALERIIGIKKIIILLKKTNLIDSTLTTSQFCNKNISPSEALQSLQMPKDRGGTAMGTGGTKLRSFLKKLIDDTKFLDDLVK